MTVRKAGAALVDVCPTCAALWVDSYDGELIQVARDSGPLEEGEPRSGGRARCPRCQEALAFHSIAGVSVFVHRCLQCGGTFVPRRAFDQLVASRGLEAGAGWDEVIAKR
jgi:Zn-finger nucleic acid-binding protein